MIYTDLALASTYAARLSVDCVLFNCGRLRENVGLWELLI